MEKVKILHCSDLHFDTKMAKLSKKDLLDVFSNIIKIAIQEDIEIMLIAGDVFDNLSVNKMTLNFLEESFKSIPDIRVFISPGNHDPYNTKSFYKLVNWPDNVYIFKGDMEKVYIKELNVNVYGAGFTENYIRQSNLHAKGEEDKINLMVIHGELSNGASKNEYNPITLENIEDSKMDYIALGHRHLYTGIHKVGKTFYAYSGCPQGRGFDELNEKGIIIGDVYKGGNSLSFRETWKRKYIELKIDITNESSYSEVKSKIMNKVSLEDRKNNLYKIILVGEINDDFIIEEELIYDMIKEHFYFIKIVDQTKIKYDFEELSKSNSIKGIFVKELLEKFNDAEEDEKSTIMMAIKLGLKALTEDEVNLYDY